MTRMRKTTEKSHSLRTHLVFRLPSSTSYSPHVCSPSYLRSNQETDLDTRRRGNYLISGKLDSALVFFSRGFIPQQSALLCPMFSPLGMLLPVRECECYMLSEQNLVRSSRSTFLQHPNYIQKAAGRREGNKERSGGGGGGRRE